MKNRIKNILQIKLTRPQIAFYRIVFIFLLPVMLFYSGLVEQRFAVPILMLLSILLIYIVYKSKYSMKDLGIETDYKLKTVLIYSAFTLIGFFGIVFFAKVLGYSPVTKWYTYAHFVFLFIPISFAQEFAYRSVLMKELSYIFDEDAQIILANAGIFTILHTMYPHPHIVLPLTMIGGLAFAALWKIKPNFLLIALAHAVLNFIAVYYDFFSIINKVSN